MPSFVRNTGRSEQTAFFLFHGDVLAVVEHVDGTGIGGGSFDLDVAEGDVAGMI